jgi:hypothetical protein
MTCAAVATAAGPAAAFAARSSAARAKNVHTKVKAGVTKSGVLAFVEFAAYAGLPTAAWILLALVASHCSRCQWTPVDMRGSCHCSWTGGGVCCEVQRS